MTKRLLSNVGIVLLVVFIGFAAFAIGKRNQSLKTTKIQQTQVTPISHNKQLPAQKQQNISTQQIVDDQTNEVAKMSKNPEEINSAQEVLFSDDFEGGQPQWQPAATWGNQAAPGGGQLDETTSDWEVVTDNFHSSTTSWRETGETFLRTDMLVGPAFTLPETVEGGLPLGSVSIDFWTDWDATDATNQQLYVYLGPDADLWEFDTTDPGAGSSSWLVVNPTDPPFDVFIRQFLTTPEIDLTNATSPVDLTFLYKSISEPEFDYNKVDVFTAADNFVHYTSVASFDGADGSAGGGTATWTPFTVNLDDYIGDVVKIRFSQNGDFGFVEPGALFALDDISVDDGGGNLFFDNGGEDGTTEMTTEGFAGGTAIVTFTGVANPTPNWINVQVPGNALQTAADGTLSPGDDVRLAFMYRDASGATAPGRGLYVDDVTVTGRSIQTDIAADCVNIPFPIVVGEPVQFSVDVTNLGINNVTSFNWQGTVLNASGNAVANVVGTFSGDVAQDSTVTVPAVTNWTPTQAGQFSVRATVNLSGDESADNNVTTRACDDPDGFGDTRYSPFFVCPTEPIFSAKLNDLGDDPTAASLIGEGLRVRSHSEPGVVTWQTTSSALVPFVNLGVDYGGAYVLFDSLGRPQDEELVIPNLDFSNITSNATLTFKGLGVAGFTFTRFSIRVSNDGGNTWTDVFERLRGVDPTTGTNFGGPAFFTVGMRPGMIDISSIAAGYSDVWISFRYQAIDDADWTIWDIAVCGEGLQAALLQSVTDIANDNGKQVRVTWDGAPNDGQSIDGVPITQYGVWRGVVENGSAKVVDNVIDAADRRDMISDIANLAPGTRFRDLATQQEWDFVGAVLAHSDSSYNYVAPTLEDGVSYPFMVSAHTANPEVFANSNVVSGSSTDNLAPGVPANVAAMEVEVSGASAVELTWTENEDPDFQYYTIYKNGTEVEQTIDLSFVDTDVTIGENITYGVTATDFAGNESAAAEVPIVVTSVGSPAADALPTDFALNQNYPNPFNPQTTIEYALPKDAFVKINIYDMLGRKVRSLVSEDTKAGYQKVQWNGRDDAGVLVGSGVYLYKITAGDFVATRKMIFLK